MTRPGPRKVVSHIGTCPSTGKRQFLTKKAARVIRGRMGEHGLSVYRCEDCEHWHLGHHGDRTRDEHRHRRTA